MTAISKLKTLPYITIFFVGVSSVVGNTPTQNDSLQTLWESPSNSDSLRFKAIYQYYLNNTGRTPETSLQVSRYHSKLAIDKNNFKELSKALNERSIAHYIMGNKDSSFHYLSKALSIAEEIKDSAMMGNLYINLGNYFHGVDNFQKAINFHSKGLEILRARHMEFEQAEVLSNIGLLYMEVKMYEFAKKYFKQAKGLYEKDGSSHKMNHIWLHLGCIHGEEERHDSALYFYAKSEKGLKEEGYLQKLGECYYYSALSYSKLGQVDTALALVEKGLRINQQLKNKQRKLTNQLLKANLLLQGHPNKATELAEYIASELNHNMEHSLKKGTYELLYKAYKRQNKAQAALEMVELYELYKDSLQTENNALAVMQEAIQKEYKSQLLQKEQVHEQEQVRLKSNMLLRTFGIVVFGLLILVWIFFGFRKKLNQQRLEKAHLLNEVEQLKQEQEKNLPLSGAGFELHREKLEARIGKKLNETDWKVLNILLNDPVISNKNIAEQAFLTTDGIGSSLRRMYANFDIKESKYMKVSLLMEAMKISNQPL